jgi:hypothetical protein
VPPDDLAAPPHRYLHHHLTCWRQSSLARALPTRLFRPEGESRVTFFDGNFSEYEQWRRKTLGDAAAHPHRIT